MEPKLHNLEAFKAILQTYRASDTARAMLSRTPFVLLAGPTGSGRDTIIGNLLASGYYYPVVTDTTRPPRTNNGRLEQDGVDYFFRREDDMLADLRAGRFIEAAIIHNQQVSGVSVRELQNAAREGKIAITDIDPTGVGTILRAKPDAIAIFLLPPRFDIWLERLKKRNPQMAGSELQRRLTTACGEFRAALAHDYYRLVVNDDLQKTVRAVDAYVRTGHSTGLEASQPAARALLQQLLSQSEQHLQTHGWAAA